MTLGQRADDPDPVGLPFFGELEDPVIFNRALTPEEVRAVMGIGNI